MKLSPEDEEHLLSFIIDNLRDIRYNHGADKLANDLIYILLKDRSFRELETECYNKLKDNLRSDTESNQMVNNIFKEINQLRRNKNSNPNHNRGNYENSTLTGKRNRNNGDSYNQPSDHTYKKKKPNFEEQNTSPEPSEYPKKFVKRKRPNQEENFGTDANQYLNSSTLYLLNVPKDSNNTTTIVNHFSQFGTVVTVNVNQEQSSAHVRFASHEEAKKAYASPIPILDNRFIKIFFTTQDEGGKPIEISPTLKKPQPIATDPVPPVSKPPTQPIQPTRVSPALKAPQPHYSQFKQHPPPFKSKPKPVYPSPAELGRQQTRADIRALRANMLKKQQELMQKLKSEHLSDEAKKIIIEEIKKLGQAIKTSLEREEKLFVTPAPAGSVTPVAVTASSRPSTPSSTTSVPSTISVSDTTDATLNSLPSPTTSRPKDLPVTVEQPPVKVIKDLTASTDTGITVLPNDNEEEEYNEDEDDDDERSWRR